MLWTTAVILILLWMLALGAGFPTGLFIHVLYTAAVALVVISLSREVTNNRVSTQGSRSRCSKQRRKRRASARQTSQPLVHKPVGKIRGPLEHIF